MTHPDPFDPPSDNGTFADRIRLLIQRVGSATEIARMCGFSEGVVRSWRDGNTDPSRARCVKLARTLGISLVWLVAGEGSMLAAGQDSLADDQTSGEVQNLPRPRSRFAANDNHNHVASVAPNGATMDAQRLDTAMRILQSELTLAGGEFSLAEHSDLLAELYGILGPDGAQVSAGAMLTFNHRLAERLRPRANA